MNYQYANSCGSVNKTDLSAGVVRLPAFGKVVRVWHLGDRIMRVVVDFGAEMWGCWQQGSACRVRVSAEGLHFDGRNLT